MRLKQTLNTTKGVKLKYNVLLVENNTYTRTYLLNLLNDNFTVFEAIDAKAGLEKALEHLPDLILSDIKLPNISGFELCSKIKNNEKLFHIPIILLTAKPYEQCEITCIRHGADDYIVLPYNPHLLKEKILSLIHSRKLLKENFSKTITIIGSKIELEPNNQKFLEKFISMVEENLQNPELDVGFIAERMNMSHASLYRRTKAINESSVIELITQIRIDRAFQLLEDKEKTLTQIAHETGFCDLKRFRQSFQKQLKMTPKEFRGTLK